MCTCSLVCSRSVTLVLLMRCGSLCSDVLLLQAMLACINFNLHRSRCYAVLNMVLKLYEATKFMSLYIGKTVRDKLIDMNFQKHLIMQHDWEHKDLKVQIQKVFLAFMRLLPYTRLNIQLKALFIQLHSLRTAEYVGRIAEEFKTLRKGQEVLHSHHLYRILHLGVYCKRPIHIHNYLKNVVSTQFPDFCLKHLEKFGWCVEQTTHQICSASKNVHF